MEPDAGPAAWTFKLRSFHDEYLSFIDATLPKGNTVGPARFFLLPPLGRAPFPYNNANNLSASSCPSCLTDSASVASIPVSHAVAGS